MNEERVKDLKDLILAKQDFPEEVILDLTELEGIGVMGIQTILAVRENLMKHKSGLKLKMKEEMEPMLTWMGLNWLKEESSVKAKILIIDDSKTIRFQVRKILESEEENQFEILEAEDGVSALENVVRLEKDSLPDLIFWTGTCPG